MRKSHTRVGCLCMDDRLVDVDLLLFGGGGKV